MIYQLWCDGGAEPNPGYCYGSYLIQTGARHIAYKRRVKLAVHGTNNEAEYWILLRALDEFQDKDPKLDTIQIHSDSRLMVEQVSGRWKCHEQRLKYLRNQVIDRLLAFGSWSLTWVPRLEMVKRFGH